MIMASAGSSLMGLGTTTMSTMTTKILVENLSGAGDATGQHS
jgi:hypothetical protein